MWRPELGVSGYAWRDWFTRSSSSRYVMRLGQAHFQLWKSSGRQLVLVACRPVEHLAYNAFSAAADEIALLTEPLPAGCGVQVLLDSKWMPLSLLNTGRAPLTKAQLHLLATHRFAQIYGEPAHHWDIQTSYVTGDVQALAFACATPLLGALRQGLGLDGPNTTVRTRLLGVQPTFGWAWNQVRGREARRDDSWFVLAEHDRSIMSRISKGRVMALHPAGPIVQNADQLACVLQLQALRCGLVEDMPQQALGVSLESDDNMMNQLAVSGIRWHVIGEPSRIQASKAAP